MLLQTILPEIQATCKVRVQDKFPHNLSPCWVETSSQSARL